MDERERRYIPCGQFKGDFKELDWLIDDAANFEGQVIRVTAKAVLLDHQMGSSTMRSSKWFPKSAITILDSWEETKPDYVDHFSREINVIIPFWAYK